MLYPKIYTYINNGKIIFIRKIIYKFTDITSHEFCLFLFYKALSPMYHILQQYNRTKLASNVFETCYISIFFFPFLLLEDYKESLIGEYCENIMFEERCELIIEEILHPTFSFLSASATGSKLHKVYTVFVR